MDEILKAWGLKYEDLNPVERDTLQSMYSSIKTETLTIEGIRGYIRQMRDSVEEELTKTGLNTHQDLFLKARLRNYMLLEGMLSGADKAKKSLEQALGNMKRGKGA